MQTMQWYKTRKCSMHSSGFSARAALVTCSTALRGACLQDETLGFAHGVGVGYYEVSALRSLQGVGPLTMPWSTAPTSGWSTLVWTHAASQALSMTTTSRYGSMRPHEPYRSMLQTNRR
jgi:hypothetical protein